MCPQLRPCWWLIACGCVGIRRCNVTTRNSAENCKGSSAMKIQSSEPKCKVTRIERNWQATWKYNGITSLRLNGTFVRRTTDLEKTTNTNWLPFSLSVTTSADAFCAQEQLSAIWRNTWKEPDFTREQSTHPSKVPQKHCLWKEILSQQRIRH